MTRTLLNSSDRSVDTRAIELPAFLSWRSDVSRNADEFLKVAHRLRAILDPISRRVAPDRWPYLSFRPIAEPVEAVEAP
jgi:hypothetical protein